VKAMFLDRPITEEKIPMPTSYNFLLGFLALAVIVFGVYFEGLRSLAGSSVKMFGHI
jgi:hypothetical protein